LFMWYVFVIAWFDMGVFALMLPSFLFLLVMAILEKVYPRANDLAPELSPADTSDEE
jgi:hypothetical protein